MKKWTTIRIDSETKSKLDAFKVVERESIDDVLCRLLDAVDRKGLVKEIADKIEQRIAANRIIHK